MKENIMQMGERHKKEIKELQDNCPHEATGNWETSRFKEWWDLNPIDASIGLRSRFYHKVPSEEIKRCKRCNKIVLKKKLVEVWQEVEV
jgi:hypothetical protein